LEEDFEENQLPAGWTKFQNNPFGWSFGTPLEWSSTGWNIPNPVNENLGHIAVTSDDRCFCDSSLDLLTTFPINIPTNLQQVTLSFKASEDEKICALLDPSALSRNSSFFFPPSSGVLRWQRWTKRNR
jgi:hypothetical protein